MGLFQNPFEKLSTENQEQLLSEARLTNDALYGQEGLLGMTGRILLNVEGISEKLDTLIETVIKTNAKTSEYDEKMAERAGAASVVMGEGLLKITEAIKQYENIDQKTVDNFVESLDKIGEALIKSGEGIKEITKAGDALKSMSSGILWFGLSLLLAGPIYLLALPLAPIVIGVIMGVMFLFSKVIPEASDKAVDGAKTLAWLSVAILGIGAALFLAGLVYQQLWTGAIGMIPILLTILALVGVMWLIDGLSNSIMDGVRALTWMTLVVGLVGVSLYLSSLVYAELWKGFGGMVAILLTIGALVGIMALIDMLSDTIYDGVKALAIMTLIVFGVGALLYLAGKFYDELFDGMVASWPILIVIGALIALMALIDSLSDTIYDGALALLVMVGAAFSAALLLYMISKWGDEMQAGLGNSWPLLILMGALIGLMYLLNGAKKEMLMGALVLGAMSVAVMILSLALQIYQQTAVAEGFDMASMGLLLLTIAGLAVEMGIIGVPVVAGFVALGAATMMLVSASVMVLAYGLAEWRAVGFKDKDAKDLQKAVVRIPMAFLGLTGDEGFFGALKQAAKTTAVLMAASFNALMMIGIGASLLTLGKGLKAFKDTKFTVSDAMNIQKIIGAVAGAFAHVTTVGGKGWSWWDVKRGIWAMQDLGGVLVDIAKGVQQWANLYISEYKYDEKSGRMVEVDRVKLTKSDFDNVAYGMKTVISALAGPLAEVGMADAGVGKGFYAQLFAGKGYVKRGISALQGVGSVLLGLAKGTQAFANMAFWEYELKKTKDGYKLFPTKKTKLTEADVDEAARNMEKVIGVAARAFAKVGMWESLGEGWFSGGYVSKGIKALTGVGGVLSEIAKGVRMFSKFQFVTYGIGKDKDGNTKVVPTGVEVLGPRDILMAELNMLLAVGATARVMAKIGKWEDDSSGWFSGGYISKGIKALTGIGDIVTGLAKGVRSFAKMEFTEYTVKNGKLVPSKRTKLTKAHISQMESNMLDVMFAFSRPMVTWYSDYHSWGANRKEHQFNTVIKLADVANQLAEKMKTATEILTKVKGLNKIEERVRLFLNGFVNPFMENANTDVLDNMGIFAGHITTLGNNYKEIGSIADSFERIAESMHTFKDGLNGLNPELLSDTKGLFEAMAVISESPNADDLVSKFGDSIKESLDRLSEIIAEWTEKQENDTPPPVNEGQGNNTTPNPVINQNNSAMTDAILKEISQKLSTGIKVKKDSGGLFGF